MSDLIPGLLFGINDTWSIFFNTPVTPLMKDGCHQSRGLEDFFIQLEYAFYNKSTRCYVDQATILTNITFPTGSVRKKSDYRVRLPLPLSRSHLLPHNCELGVLYLSWRSADQFRPWDKNWGPVPVSIRHLERYRHAQRLDLCLDA